MTESNIHNWVFSHGVEVMVRKGQSCHQDTHINVNNINNHNVKSVQMIYSKCKNKKYFPSHISLTQTEAEASFSSWLHDMIY